MSETTRRAALATIAAIPAILAVPEARAERHQSDAALFDLREQYFRASAILNEADAEHMRLCGLAEAQYPEAPLMLQMRSHETKQLIGILSRARIDQLAAIPWGTEILRETQRGKRLAALEEWERECRAVDGCHGVPESRAAMKRASSRRH